MVAKNQKIVNSNWTQEHMDLLKSAAKDERVNKITPKLFKMAASPEKMSKIPQQKIYDIIKPCGLGPKKSKAY